MYEFGVTKEMVNEYWLRKDYDLQIPSILGNCDLCFLKGKNAIISILREFPELAAKWIRDEDMALLNGEKKGYRYLPDITYRQLLELAQKPYYKQQDLFEIQPAHSCSCTT